MALARNSSDQAQTSNNQKQLLPLYERLQRMPVEEFEAKERPSVRNDDNLNACPHDDKLSGICHIATHSTEEACCRLSI